MYFLLPLSFSVVVSTQVHVFEANLSQLCPCSLVDSVAQCCVVLLTGKKEKVILIVLYTYQLVDAVAA